MMAYERRWERLTSAIHALLIFVRDGGAICGSSASIRSPWMKTICYPPFVMWKQIGLLQAYVFNQETGSGQANHSNWKTIGLCRFCT